MQEIINILFVSCIPAAITGVVTYLTASRNAKAQIASLQESNKHEIEKLMRQHEVDIESLKEKHHLEAEKSEQEHRHKIEIMEIEHRNALESKEKEQSNAAMFGVMADVVKDPSKLRGLLELANNPAFKKEIDNREENCMDLKWLFDGIGTELLSLCVASIVGGIIGYKIGVKGASKQKQKAGTNAEQNQELEVDFETVKSEVKTELSQVQKAKDYASQSQVGRIKIDNE